MTRMGMALLVTLALAASAWCAGEPAAAPAAPGTGPGMMGPMMEQMRGNMPMPAGMPGGMMEQMRGNMPMPAGMPGGMMEQMRGGMPMSGGMLGGMMEEIRCGMVGRRMAGCMAMIDGMLGGEMNLLRCRQALGLTDAQVDALQVLHRALQKTAIISGSAAKVAAIELTGLLDADSPDLAAVEAKLKEMEGRFTSLRLERIKGALEVRKILTPAQIERLNGLCSSCPLGASPAPPAKSTEAPAAQPSAVPSEHKH